MRSRVVVLALAALMLLSACSDGSDSTHFTFSSATKIGALIPVKDRKPPKAFTGSLLSGGKITISGAPGKVMLVNFWAAWCGPCKIETPQFDLLYRRIRSRGVDFVGIDTKDTRGEASSFVKDENISYPIVFDQPGRALLTLGNFRSALPFTVLLDKQGRVAAVYVARLATKDLDGPLDTLLAEK